MELCTEGDEGGLAKARELSESVLLTVRLGEGGTGGTGEARGRDVDAMAAVGMMTGRCYDLAMMAMTDTVMAERWDRQSRESVSKMSGQPSAVLSTR